MASSGSRPSSRVRNLLMRSPNPSHIMISTTAYEAKFAAECLELRDRVIFARGWGNACVGVHGILHLSILPWYGRQKGKEERKKHT